MTGKALNFKQERDRVRLAPKKLALVPGWIEDEFKRKQTEDRSWEAVTMFWKRDEGMNYGNEERNGERGQSEKYLDDESSRISGWSDLISGEGARRDRDKGRMASRFIWNVIHGMISCATNWNRDTDKSLFPLTWWQGLFFVDVDQNIRVPNIYKAFSFLSSTLLILSHLTIIATLEDKQGSCYIL